MDGTIIGLALLAVGAPFVAAGVVREWRAGGSPEPPDNWRYSERLWWAWARCGPASVIGVFGGLFVAGLGIAIPGKAGTVIFAAGAWTFVLGVALVLSTALFGVPRGLIPRNLRDLPSLFSSGPST
jgi:hypothetical protein